MGNLDCRNFCRISVFIRSTLERVDWMISKVWGISIVVDLDLSHVRFTSSCCSNQTTSQRESMSSSCGLPFCVAVLRRILRLLSTPRTCRSVVMMNVFALRGRLLAPYLCCLSLVGSGRVIVTIIIAIMHAMVIILSIMVLCMTMMVVLYDSSSKRYKISQGKLKSIKTRVFRNFVEEYNLRCRRSGWYGSDWCCG